MSTPTRKKPPVVVVVGHIDHGKSTLLDFIRKSNVVAGETGGITQHVSAYEVRHTVEGSERAITFLDTPGHEAFSSMRNRGAKLSDIAILLVSAEEGVKAQTVEALKSVREAEIPFVVAINKIDRPNANPEKVKQELAEHEVFVESYGGTIPSVNISAKTGVGIDELLDILILVSDLEAKDGDESATGEALILETNRDPKIGITITAIIKNGTLKVGDFVAVEGLTAKIKKLENFLGQSVTSATFSAPVVIYGFAEVPSAGGLITVLKDKKAADTYTKEYVRGSKASTTSSNFINSNDPNNPILELPMILKADTLGTLEAVYKEVSKFEDERVRLKIIGQSIGAITDSDVKLATGSAQAIILGFQVKADNTAKDLAERAGITLASFDIIYKMTEWLIEELAKRRPKVTVEETTGAAKILKCFSTNKDKQVVGGQVTEGVIVRGKEVKIIRRGVEIGRGKISELEQHKVKADRIEPPGQFGTMIDSKIMIATGDIIEIFERVAK